MAEELNAPIEAITTVVTGDTDRTPDGSGAFDFLQEEPELYSDRDLLPGRQAQGLHDVMAVDELVRDGLILHVKAPPQ